MQDIIKSIKAYLYDRSSSPLLGAFVCAWVAWNFKVFLIVFSSEKILDKLYLIDTYWDSKRILSIKGHELYIPAYDEFLAPTIITVLYLYAYPYLAKHVYGYYLDRQSELKTIKQTKERLRLLSVEESRDLIIKHEQLEEKYTEETEQLREQLKAYKDKLSEYESKDYQGDSESVLSLSDQEFEVLDNFSNMEPGEYITAEFLKVDKQIPIDLARIMLRKLEDKDYIEFYDEIDGDTAYKLSDKGRELLYNNGKLS